MTHDGVADPTEYWRRRRTEVLAVEDDARSASEWNDLAEAYFWSDEIERSLDARRSAYRRAAESNDATSAASAAWRLFYEHFLVGEDSVAHGWLARGRRHMSDSADARVEAWFAIADGDIALRAGEASEGLAQAGRALAVGRAFGDPDITAMALQLSGRARIAMGERQPGLGDLDEAMVAVINDELDPQFTGWIYCNVISTCSALGDLRRATEWSDAAMRWCSALRDGRLYRGLCRVYAAELDRLRGEWDAAELGAAQAIDELMAHDVRYAGEAVYLHGDLQRLRGRFDEAESAFGEAHRLGRVPQPGLALLRLAQGRTAEAVAAIRAAVAIRPTAPFPAARLLAAAVDIVLADDQPQAARSLADELAHLGAPQLPLFEAFHGAAAGRVKAAQGDPVEGSALLRRACEVLQDLGLRYDVACQRLHLAVLATESGDADTAQFELEAALGTFVALGAPVEAARARELLVEVGSVQRDDHALQREGGPLTERELDVVRLVRQGMTNRQIAGELGLSHHTVGRHLGNIFAKLGVSTRAAATAAAIRLGFVEA